MSETKSWLERQEGIQRAHDENMEAHKELMASLDQLGEIIAALARAINRVAKQLEDEEQWDTEKWNKLRESEKSGRGN